MNKVLIIGLGSIGLRHLQCLLEIGENNIAAFRTKKGKLKHTPEILEKIVVFTTINDAINWNPTHVVISNPTSLHVEYLKIFYKYNVKIFVEKPIVSDYNIILSDEDFLKDIRNTDGLVGFNLRFHGLFREIKKVIDTSVYGLPLSSCLMVGYYLPFWHPYEDYRTSYVSNKSLGGGALRTLSHEIDLAQYFFGHFNKVFAKISKVSQLETDTDDSADIYLENEKCSRVNIHIDLLSPQIKRRGYIYFEKGLLEYDFTKSVVHFTSYENNEPQIIYNQKEDYNLQYINQMTDFLEGNNSVGCTFSEGLEVDKLIAYSEMSSNKGVELCLT